MHTLEEIAALLHVHREATAHGDSLKNIADSALKQLRKIDSSMGQSPVEIPTDAPEEEKDE